MSSERNNLIRIEEVVGTSAQISQLYRLLSDREYCISHESLPTYAEHSAFVLSKPYKAWYLVFSEFAPVGSFYVQEDNSVGINLTEHSRELVATMIDLIHSTVPLSKEIPSKIPPYFAINIPLKNQALKEILTELGHTPIQTTFRINLPLGN